MTYRCAVVRLWLVLFALLCGCGGAGLLAQPLVFQQFSAENGLSGNVVLSIAQDRQGFLWVGTSNGLNRYDGYQFKHYKNDQEEPGSISSNSANALLFDRDGFLWVGTKLGLNRFDPKTERFEHFRRDSARAGSLHSDEIFALFEDEAGVLWVGTDKGLERFDARTKRFEHWDFPQEVIQSDFRDFRVQHIVETDGGDLLLGTRWASVWRFDKKTQRMQRVSANGIAPNEPQWTQGFVKDADGTVWMADLTTCYKLEPGGTIFKSVYQSPNRGFDSNICCFFRTKEGQWLLGTNGEGLKTFDRNFQKIAEQLPNLDRSSPDANLTNCIFQDRGGEVWLGMIWGGLFKFDPQRKPFQSFQRWSKGHETSYVKDVGGVCERQNGEIGTASLAEGCHFLDPKTERFTPFSDLPRLPKAIKQDYFLRIFEDSKQRLWLGGWGRGLKVLDEKTGDFHQFLNLNPNKNPTEPDYICGIGELADGRMWVSTLDGLIFLSADETQKPLTRKFSPQFYTELGGVPMRYITNILTDHTGKYWIPSRGLVCLDPKTGDIQVFKHDPQRPETIGDNRVSFVFEDRKRRLWVGTSGGGLNLWQPEAQRFAKFKQKNGLPSDVVAGITDDDQGFLWLTTARGLCKFDPETHTASNYFLGDGLPCERFVIAAIGKSRPSGKIFAGGQDGFVLFHPDSIRNSNFLPPVVISSLKKYVVAGDQIRPTEVPGIATMDLLELPFSENTLTFEFAALNFRQSFKNQYAYRLEGMGDQWVQVGTHRTVTFSHLAAGRYVLHVRASNNDGLWNEKGARLEIIILPPWWASWWALLAYTLTLGGVGFAFYRLQTRRNQDKEEAKRQKLLNEAKSQFLSTASHELRTPLTSVMGFAKIIKKRLEERILPHTDRSDSKTDRAVEQVTSNLDIVISESERLTALINDVLDLAKIESGKAVWHEERLHIAHLVERAIAATTTLFEQKNLALRSRVEPTLPTTLGDPDRLLQVLVNLLSNAAKFTERGIVTVTARQQNERTLLLGVADTGIGIPEKEREWVFEKFRQVRSGTLTDKPQGTGLGLPICREIVEHHGGRIWVESAAEGAEGSVFWFTLPLR